MPMPILWLRLIMGCAASQCEPGDVLRIDPAAVPPVLRLRDGAGLDPDPAKLATAILNGWVVILAPGPQRVPPDPRRPKQ